MSRASLATFRTTLFAVCFCLSLPSLTSGTSCSGTFYITSTPSAELAACTSISGSLNAQDASLTAITSAHVPLLRSVSGTVDISSLPSLVSIEGLFNLTTVGTLSIRSLDSLQSLAGLDALTTITASLSVQGNAVLASVELPSLTTAAGLTVSSSPAVLSVSLPALTSAGVFMVRTSDEIRNISAPVLQTVELLELNDLPQLNLVQFPQLATVGTVNPTGVKLHSLPVLFPSNAHFESLTSAAALDLNTLPFTSLASFSSLQQVTVSSISLTRMDDLADASLPALEFVKIDISFLNLPLITSVHLGNLTRVDGTLMFSNMAFLVNASAPALGFLGGITVQACHKLQDVSQLAPNIETLPLGLRIESTSLAELRYRRLVFVGSLLRIWLPKADNDTLAFDYLRTADSVDIDCVHLRSLSFLSNLTHATKFLISATIVDELHLNLEVLTRELDLRTVSGARRFDLPRLRSIGGLSIVSCHDVQAIHLAPVVDIGDEVTPRGVSLTFSDNLQLLNFTLRKPAGRFLTSLSLDHLDSLDSIEFLGNIGSEPQTTLFQVVQLRELPALTGDGLAPLATWTVEATSATIVNVGVSSLGGFLSQIEYTPGRPQGRFALTVESCANLVAVENLSAELIGLSLVVGTNPMIQRVALPHVTDMPRITLENNPSLHTVSAPNVAQIVNIIIHHNNITSLASAFNAVQSLTRIEVRDEPFLRDVDGLAAVETASYVLLANLPELQTCEGLASLQTATSQTNFLGFSTVSLVILNAPALRSCRLCSLQSVSSSAIVQDVPSLSCADFADVVDSVDSVTVTNCDAASEGLFSCVTGIREIRFDPVADSFSPQFAGSTDELATFDVVFNHTKPQTHMHIAPFNRLTSTVTVNGEPLDLDGGLSLDLPAGLQRVDIVVSPGAGPTKTVVLNVERIPRPLEEPGGNMTMRLDAPYPQSGAEVEAFKPQFVADIVAAVNADPSRGSTDRIVAEQLEIEALVEGSIIVVFVVLPNPDGFLVAGGSPILVSASDIVGALVDQYNTTGSPLLSGNVTSSIDRKVAPTAVDITMQFCSDRVWRLAGSCPAFCDPDENVCLNGAECVVQNATSFSCICPPGYFGRDCGLDLWFIDADNTSLSGLDAQGRLGTTSGGQTLTLAASLFNVQRVDVFVGPAEDPQRFPCALVEDSVQFPIALPNVTTLECVLPPAYGADLGVALKITDVQGQLATRFSSAFSFSYPLPHVRSDSLRLCDPSDCVDPKRSVVGTSPLGDIVEFAVDNWYASSTPLEEDVRIVYQSLSNALLFGECSVLSMTASSVRCQMQPNVGQRFVFTVFLGGASQNSTGTDEYSYPTLPEITSVSGCPQPDPDNSNATFGCATLGGDRLTIRGKRFVFPFFVSIDNKLCGNANLTVDNLLDSEVQCDSPGGTGYLQPVLITVGGVASQPRDFVSFEEPVPERISGSPPCVSSEADRRLIFNCSRVGSGSFTLHGRSFGATTGSVLVGGRVATILAWNDSRIEAQLPPGTEQERAVLVLQHHGQLSSEVMELSYFQCPAGSRNEGLACAECPPGSFSAGINNDACSSCPAGTSASAAGSPVCSECAPGSVANETGAVACAPCPFGSVSLRNRVACAACPPGRFHNNQTSTCDLCVGKTFQPDSSRTSCEECPAGSRTVSDKTGCVPCPAGTRETANECVACLDGELAPVGSTVCEACEAGTVPNDAATACVPCAAGRYSSSGVCVPCEGKMFQNETGSDHCRACGEGHRTVLSNSGCEPCQSGTYENDNQCVRCTLGHVSSAVGASTCTECSAGHAPNSVDNPVACIACPPGKAEVNHSCVECESGQVALQPGSTLCTPCPPGTRPDEEGTGCDPCEPGTFSDTPGARECELCAAGKQQFERGQASCEWCPVGKFAALRGQPLCVDCPRGRFNERPGELSCNATLRGHYQPTTGQNVSLVCPAGTFSNAPGAIECSSCARGTYQLLAAQDKCLQCPEQAKVCGLDLLVSSSSGWLEVSDDGSARVYECPVGYCADGNGCEPHRKPESPLCGECVDGYAEWGGKCVECESANAGVIFSTLLISLAVVLVIHKTSQVSHSATLKVFMYFFATSLFMMDASHTSEHLFWLRLLNLDVFNTSGGCFAPMDAYEQLVLDLFTPFVLFATLGCCFGVAKLYQMATSGVPPSSRKRARSRKRTRAQSALVLVVGGDTDDKHASGGDADEDIGEGIGAKQTAADRAEIHVTRPLFAVESGMRTLLALYLFSYTHVATTSLRFWTCFSVAGERIVFYNPSMDCNSTSYSALAVLVALFLVGYVIVPPFLMGYWLKRNRVRLWDPPTLSRFGVLYEMYTDNGYWFQPFFLLRRAVLVVTDVVLFRQGSDRFMAFAFVHFMFFCLHVLIKPMRRKADNDLETLCLFTLVLISVVLLRFSAPVSQSVLILLDLLTLAPLVIVGVHFLRNASQGKIDRVLDCLGVARAKQDDGEDTPNKSVDAGPRGSMAMRGSVAVTVPASVQLQEVPRARSSSGTREIEDEEDEDDLEPNPLFAAHG